MAIETGRPPLNAASLPAAAPARADPRQSDEGRDDLPLEVVDLFCRELAPWRVRRVSFRRTPRLPCGEPAAGRAGREVRSTAPLLRHQPPDHLGAGLWRTFGLVVLGLTHATLLILFAPGDSPAGSRPPGDAFLVCALRLASGEPAAGRGRQPGGRLRKAESPGVNQVRGSAGGETLRSWLSFGQPFGARAGVFSGLQNVACRVMIRRRWGLCNCRTPDQRLRRAWTCPRRVAPDGNSAHSPASDTPRMKRHARPGAQSRSQRLERRGAVPCPLQTLPEASLGGRGWG
jgi:hypothetical protein